MTLIVCPLRDVETVVRFRRPSHLITLLDPHLMGESPRFRPDRHLKIAVDDIWEPSEGMVPPDETVIARILDFGRTWDAASPLLVHCWAGVSRSTATAFILACERHPDVKEATIAQALRKASPSATPNPLLVQLADEMLGRKGRMVDAVACIGQGVYAYPGSPFELGLAFGDQG
ncbi:MAG: tyrosine phosphatase family protein [Pseudomonadota bacterium]